MQEKEQSDSKPRRGGRKPLQAGELAVPVMVKMTAAQKAKLQRLGGSVWIRARIDKAKEPMPKE